VFAQAVQHLRYALRSLARSPGFSVTAVLTLALGIGATTAVFSVFSAALLAPLPYPNASRLVAVAETRGDQEISVSWADFSDWRAQAGSFEQMAAFRGRSVNLSGDGEPERLRGMMVTANLFPVLGVQPLLGRAFLPEEDEPGSERVAAIGYRLWQQRFGGDRDIIGRSVTLSGDPHTIVAVMPDGFRFPDGIVYGPAQVWLPMRDLGAEDRATRNSHPGLVVMGLLRPGRTLDDGRAELARVQGGIAQGHEEQKLIGVKVRSGVDAIVGEMKGAFGTVLGAAGLLLLIACANVAGLLLARASARRRDIAVRTALGASRRHLLADLLAEGSAIAGIGGILGLLLAYALVGAGRASIASLPRLDALAVDVRALGLVMVIVMAIAVVFGLVPALLARTPAGAITIRGGSSDAPSSRARRALVAVEIGVALVVLISATLLARSFVRMRADTGGVKPAGVLAFDITIPESRYDAPRAAAFLRTLQERLASIPGVTAASGVSVLPFSGSGSQSGIRTMESPAVRESERTTDVSVALPGYFAAMGIELVRGRVFEAGDTTGDHRSTVTVVDEQFAEANWPGQDPIGHEAVGWGFMRMTVIGVVRHVKPYGVTSPSRQELYVPQAVRPYTRMTIVMRTPGDPEALIAPARRAVAELDAEVPIFSVATMDDLMDATVAAPRLVAFLATAFGSVALLLAAVGLYGLMAFVVASRTREIGIRMAVGATSTSVLRLVVRQSLALAGVGVVLGVAGALAAAPLIRRQLFGVSPTDPVVYGLLPAIMLLVALLASLAPALRASRVSPLSALAED
jgi:putative ABC transport system permease protein